MDRRRLWRRIRRVWITLGLAATGVFVIWSLIAYRASAAARTALQPDTAVAVEYGDGIWSFVPRRPTNAGVPALVFFPGALVDPVAYAPLVRAAAAAGFPAYIIELPRRGALGGADDPALEQRLDRLLAASSTPRRWVIAGHSRGAVVASRIAAERRTGFTGLVLIGTTHPRDVDLSTLAVAVTKVVGTRDGLASALCGRGEPREAAGGDALGVDRGGQSLAVRLVRLSTRRPARDDRGRDPARHDDPGRDRRAHARCEHAPAG